MKVDVLLGLQWGDEGKGKIVDFLTPNYNVIARFQGGPNAGHTLEFNNIKHVLHTIPSGIFHDNTENLIGNGVVIDPIILISEIEKAKAIGTDIFKTLLISKKAHLILPTHRLLDAANENKLGKNKIGSTLKGIGPCYTDKVARKGLRVGDILSNDFIKKFNIIIESHKQQLDFLEFEYDLESSIQDWLNAIDKIRMMKIVDGEWFINHAITNNKKILAEGAQGSLLDIDYGSYPFVTSSNTISAGVCTGLGIAPNKTGNILGIFKAYCTRVGSGPFPTELFDADGENLRTEGNEFGSTTGRPRRCGWLDLVALKYSIMINGVSELYMMKTDVLDSFQKIKVATAYIIDGKRHTEMPYELSQNIEPEYVEFKAWNTDTSKFSKFSELPVELLQYIKFIEEETGVPIKIVSVGPNRNQTIISDNF
ncbi:MAG TPA: adenylosuccinate synthase [Bacteroidales bacterium]|nr:adenylosuccinate synthase [Bacteroidales bacterium]